MGNNSLRNPKTIAILKELARNPRVSIRFLSLKLGINYLTARHRVLSLLRKNKISFGLLVSADIVGREVALVR
ncbi:MAG: winged helix-turn-helix transcriptional regulator, partial [Desulfurococcaceae archaeon]